MKIPKKILAAALSTGIIFSMPISAYATETITVSTESNRWDNNVTTNTDGTISVVFRDLTIKLPSSWSGKAQMVFNGDSVQFHHVTSYQDGTDSLLFTIYYVTDDSWETASDATVIGNIDGGVYYAIFTSSSTTYDDTEYQNLLYNLYYIKANITMNTTSDAATDSDTITISSAYTDSDYILPDSSTAYISASDISGMTQDEIQMAINEIYARHGRKFVTESIQEYFNAKSWYTATTEADAFDVSVFSTIEQTNINTLVAARDGTSATTSENTITIQ